MCNVDNIKENFLLSKQITTSHDYHMITIDWLTSDVHQSMNNLMACISMIEKLKLFSQFGSCSTWEPVCRFTLSMFYNIINQEIYN